MTPRSLFLAGRTLGVAGAQPNIIITTHSSPNRTDFQLPRPSPAARCSMHPIKTRIHPLVYPESRVSDDADHLYPFFCIFPQSRLGLIATQGLLREQHLFSGSRKVSLMVTLCERDIPH